MGKVYIPFSGGGCGLIEVTCTDLPRQYVRNHIDLAYDNNFDPSVTDAFSRAARLTWSLLAKMGLWKRGARYEFFCDVKDSHGNSLADKMIGGSGGLACALALAYNLRGIKGKKSIAATGEVSNPITGKIGDIDDLDSKLRGAVANLPAKGIIFYPLEGKVPDDIRKQAKEQEIELRAVSTLEEAAKHLGLLKKRVHRPFLIVAVFFVAVALAVFYNYASFPLAIGLLENGKYTIAEAHINLASHIIPWQDRVLNLRQDLNDRLHTGFFFRYLLQNGEEGLFKIQQVPRGMSLSSLDSYAFRITPSCPVYLYIYEIDSFGEIRVLFPCQKFAAYKNPLETQEKYSFPQGKKWLHPMGNKGAIETYLIASRWKCRDLEETLLSLENKKVFNVRKMKLDMIIEKRDRSGHGSMVESIVFWHK